MIFPIDFFSGVHFWAGVVGQLWAQNPLLTHTRKRLEEIMEGHQKIAGPRDDCGKVTLSKPQ